MDKSDREQIKKRIRLPSANVDTVINELRFKKKGDEAVIRDYTVLSADEDKGVVERKITEAIEDTRGRPIKESAEIGGICKVCEKTIRKGEAVECEGRCGELICKGCYQKQGSHFLRGRKYCRWDYWMTKLFWQWFSPALRYRPKETAEPEKNRGFLEYEKPRRTFQ